jgi:hypothetical protein
VPPSADHGNVPMSVLAERILAPYWNGANITVDIDDAVVAPPGKVNDYAMIFHELATNSAKYGALSGGGRLRVQGRTDGDGMRVAWDEEPAPSDSSSRPSSAAWAAASSAPSTEAACASKWPSRRPDARAAQSAMPGRPIWQSSAKGRASDFPVFLPKADWQKSTPSGNPPSTHRRPWEGPLTGCSVDKDLRPGWVDFCQSVFGQRCTRADAAVASASDPIGAVQSPTMQELQPHSS